MNGRAPKVLAILRCYFCRLSEMSAELWAVIGSLMDQVDVSNSLQPVDCDVFCLLVVKQYW